jgi:glycosyltransferase involved in cell wall biosynthesis
MSLRFSVVIPSYRQGHFIQRTIESILSQAVDFYLLVIDGGSQDQTLNILDSYGSELHWISETDEGQADAVNKGISMLTGDIIAWLNSDDIYFPGAPEKVEAVSAKYPDIQVVYGNADWIDEYDNPLKFFPAESWSYQRLKARPTSSVNLLFF